LLPRNTMSTTVTTAQTSTLLQSAAPPSAKVSRYRALRGKSISGARRTESAILDDVDDDNSATIDQHCGYAYTIGGEAQIELVKLRRRSKSVTALDLTRVPPLPDFPFPPPTQPFDWPDFAGESSSRSSSSSRSRSATGGDSYLGQKLKAARAKEHTLRNEEPNRDSSLGAALPKPDDGKPAKRKDAGPRSAANRHGLDSNYTIDADGGGGDGASIVFGDTTFGVAAAAAALQPHPHGLDRRRKEEEEAEEAARWADEVARLEAETDRILAEQRKRDLLRAQQLQHPLQAPSRREIGSPLSRDKLKSPVLEKFHFFGRGRRSNASHTTISTLTNPTSPSTSLSTPSSAATSMDFTHAMDSPRFIEVGGKGIVPQVDAPLTASNAGERVSFPFFLVWRIAGMSC
jgi:hypothetical protein